MSKKSPLLLDRDCILLDGRCKCEHPMEDCKYLTNPTHGGKIYNMKYEDEDKK